jgi:hypothetical protein
MGETTISEILTYVLICIAIPMFFIVTVFVFISSFRANQRIVTFKGTADESMEMSKKQITMMEDVITLQKESNILLKEIITKIK